MKLSHLTLEQLKKELDKRNKYIEEHYLYSHKDRRHKSLLNEYSRRIMERVI